MSGPGQAGHEGSKNESKSGNERFHFVNSHGKNLSKAGEQQYAPHSGSGAVGSDVRLRNTKSALLIELVETVIASATKQSRAKSSILLVDCHGGCAASR